MAGKRKPIPCKVCAKPILMRLRNAKYCLACKDYWALYRTHDLNQMPTSVKVKHGLE